MPLAYYNENDPYCAQWLRNLISEKLIAPGDVDERSILDVRPADLRGYTQHHFFAGIGGWSLALRLADWPDTKKVWTGSCPCQPFSAAGKRRGFADDRHLWPYWRYLIAVCRPPIIFGEQVAAAIKQGWLDAVFSDLESQGYACGAAVLPACGVGAPHIRQRMWFVADDAKQGRQSWGRTSETSDGGDAPRIEPGRLRDARQLADSDGRDASAEGLQRGGEHRQRAQDGETVCDLAHAAGGRFGELRDAAQPRCGGHIDGSFIAGELGEPASVRRPRVRPESTYSEPRQAGENIFGRRLARTKSWQNRIWLPCTDGKARPVEPGTFPLAHGIPGRVGRLRAYGNAIVPQAAAES